MSYARFGDGTYGEVSDVYVFVSDHGIECCGCRMDRRGGFSTPSTAAMVEHLTAHVARGDTVPEDVIPALLADAAENEHYIVHGEWPPSFSSETHHG